MGDMGPPEMPPMPQSDPSMIGQPDPNAMPPADMGVEQPPMGDGESQGDDSGVDKGAEQDAGNLSNILGTANSETANYVGNMIASALGKNPELNSSDRKKMADKIVGSDTEDEGMPQDEGQEPPMQESMRRINKLIDETLDAIMNNSSVDKRPNTKLPRKHSVNNPFVSPKEK